MVQSGEGTVLIVDDDVDVAESYASQLRAEFAVEVAYDGEAALSALSPSVDAVLLDRRMPKRSGETVLEAIRDRDLETRVAMVTAEEPDFDIIEMPFDDYVQKPATEAELFETVRRLKRFVDYEEQVREYYALTAKRAALVESKLRAELDASEQFQALEADIEATRATLSDITAGFEATDFDRAFKAIERSQSPPNAH